MTQVKTHNPIVEEHLVYAAQKNNQGECTFAKQRLQLFIRDFGVFREKDVILDFTGLCFLFNSHVCQYFIGEGIWIRRISAEICQSAYILIRQTLHSCGEITVTFHFNQE